MGHFKDKSFLAIDCTGTDIARGSPPKGVAYLEGLQKRNRCWLRLSGLLGTRLHHLCLVFSSTCQHSVVYKFAYLLI